MAVHSAVHARPGRVDLHAARKLCFTLKHHWKHSLNKRTPRCRGHWHRQQRNNQVMGCLHVLILAPAVADLIINHLLAALQDLLTRKPQLSACATEATSAQRGGQHLAVLLDPVKVSADLHVAIHAVPLQVVILVDVQPVPPVGHDLRIAAKVSALATAVLSAALLC